MAGTTDRVFIGFRFGASDCVVWSKFNRLRDVGGSECGGSTWSLGATALLMV